MHESILHKPTQNIKVKVENSQSTEWRTQRANERGSYISPKWASDPEKQV
jgi:hypothetical protein